MIRSGSQMGKSFARQRSQKFNWQRLVTPWTPKDFVAHCTAVSKDIASKQALTATLSKDVPNIDWAQWNKVIKAPGVVDALKKEYESIKFNDASTESLEPLKAQNIKHIAVAEANLGAAKGELAAADKALAAIQEIQKDGLHWKADQWMEKIPGLEKQLQAQFEDEDYLPNEEEEKVAVMDFGELEKEFLSGNLEGECASTIGDKNMTEEKEVLEAGEWTVARLFADKVERGQLREQVRKANSDSAAAAAAIV